MITIRHTREDDARLLPEIERSSGEIFRLFPGLEWIADDVVQSEERHRGLIASGASFVAETPSFGVVAFLNGEVADHALHIWQMAVRRDHQGRGIGRLLLDAAVEVAKQRGIRTLTLTTFLDVPWNAPFYSKLGFFPLGDSECSPRLRAILSQEASEGLPAERRCAMRRTL